MSYVDMFIILFILFWTYYSKIDSMKSGLLLYNYGAKLWLSALIVKVSTEHASIAIDIHSCGFTSSKGISLSFGMHCGLPYFIQIHYF